MNKEKFKTAITEFANSKQTANDYFALLYTIGQNMQLFTWDEVSSAIEESVGSKIDTDWENKKTKKELYFNIDLNNFSPEIYQRIQEGNLLSQYVRDKDFLRFYDYRVYNPNSFIPTKEQLERLKEDIEKIEPIAKEIQPKVLESYRNYRKLHSTIIQMAKVYDGDKSNLLSYVSKYHSSRSYSDEYWPTRFIETLKHKLEFGIINREKLDYELNQKKEQETIVNEAMKYLLDNNKVFMKDFDISNAYKKANELAFEIAKNNEIKRIRETGDYISFNYQNCDDCSGWDGESNRCSCGNRKVYWTEGYGHSFKNPYIYATAD